MRKCLFIYDGELEQIIESTAEERRASQSWSDGTGRRSDPTRETLESVLRTPSTGVEATLRRVIGSSWERE